MLPTARADLKPNTEAFENTPLVKPTGFREYDARWLFPQDVNLLGIQALGMGLGTQMAEKGLSGRIVVGHDYRSYSQSIKQALIVGLMATGADVVDIGLAVSPMAYYAQFLLDSPAVAMVTASHNENGWTGVKIGMERPLTHGPEDMGRLKEIVLSGKFVTGKRGSYTYAQGVGAKYVEDLLKAGPVSRKLKVVAACGNGTAGLFAEEVLTKLGCSVIPLHTSLDYTFPHHNPNPEDMHMLHAVADAVKEHGADVGLAFDGDGDRIGIIDSDGSIIWGDQMLALLARDVLLRHPGAPIIADVKSSQALFDDVARHGGRPVMWKTGHAPIKSKMLEENSPLAGEMSAHIFMADGYYGFDDALYVALRFLNIATTTPGGAKAMRASLPQLCNTPEIRLECGEERKFALVRALRERLARDGIRFIDIDGVRVQQPEGWWLLRASNTQPIVVARAEAADEAGLERLMTNLRAYLADCGFAMESSPPVPHT